MIYNFSKDIYHQKGFLSLNDFFSKQFLGKIESAIIDLYLIQAEKIDDYRHQLSKLKEEKKSEYKFLSDLLNLMEKNDKEALYQTQQFFSISPFTRSIINDDLVELCAGVLGSKRNNLLFDGPSLFVNRPNSERLLYKWHSEAHYYPKRRNFLNLWIPLFDSKSKNNGTMSFKVGSHKYNFPFSEYKGYNKDTEGARNFFLQYEIPKCFLKDFNVHYCECNKGDLVLFHKDLVHSSNPNISSNYSFALVLRAFDPSKDLTISGKMSSKPYIDDIGRSNLSVSYDL